MSIWRWLIGDTDEPLGPESERGLFNHFNRPESLPWPPDHPNYIHKSLVPLTDKPKPRQFRPPVSDPTDQYYPWDSITVEESLPKLVPCPAWHCGGDRGPCGLCGDAGEVTAEMAKNYYDWNDRPPLRRGSAHGEFRISTNEPRELKPTVGLAPMPAAFSETPPVFARYCQRPKRVEDALLTGDIHPDVYEYLVHLETHFARTAHHGK